MIISSILFALFIIISFSIYNNIISDTKMITKSFVILHRHGQRAQGYRCNILSYEYYFKFYLL
jgi:hypothetical protein